MASVPCEKRVGELCSECRPVSLGVQAHLRSFEVLGGGGKRKRGKGEGEGEEGERDWGFEGEEIKKDLKALEEAFRGLDIKDTIDAGNKAKDKRHKGEGEGTKGASLWKEKGEWVDVKTRQGALATTVAADKEENEDQATNTKVPLPDVGKKETEIEVQAPAGKEEPHKPTELFDLIPRQAQTTVPTNRAAAKSTTTKSSILTSLLKIFTYSHPSPSTSPTTSPQAQNQTQDQTQTENKPKNGNTEQAEIWISIAADPDWEAVTEEDKIKADRKLWKDKGEWINVNSGSKQEN